MSEMVERAIKALEDAEADGLIDGDWPEVVRVVIASMREPTEAMIAVMAGYDWSGRLERVVPPRLMRPFEDDAADCWGEMIDEALK